MWDLFMFGCAMIFQHPGEVGSLLIDWFNSLPVWGQVGLCISWVLIACLLGRQCHSWLADRWQRRDPVVPFLPLRVWMIDLTQDERKLLEPLRTHPDVALALGEVSEEEVSE